MYPPRVSDSTAGLTFQYFGWEESRLPQDIVDDFNAYLSGIGTMSNYVKTVLVDSGVTVPICVTGVGVHAPDRNAKCTAAEVESLGATVFLHISSAFPRKGVDVLLRAYFETFTDDDDVSLLLKTFPNPHNEVSRLLAELRAEFPAAPHVCWIDRDFDREEVDGLYNLATCYVHPARGEGFGLPVAEAMLAGVPVISVGATGLADFVNPQTAAVIRHTTAAAQTHLSIPGSEWIEPSIDDLRRELAVVARGHEVELRRSRVHTARELIETEFTWHRVGDRWHDFITSERRRARGVSVAAVSTFNTRCGIAEYTTRLYDAMGGWAVPELFADDNVTPLDAHRELLVQRVWTNDRRATADRLLAALDRSDADLVHVQHNFGFFTLPELARIIRQETPRRPIVLTLHRTSPLVLDDGIESLADIAPDLRSVDAIIVHQETDRQRLHDAGVHTNVQLIPIGTEPHVEVDVEAARRRLHMPSSSFVVGVFGFLLPHKGVLTVLRSVASMRERGIDARVVATCALHPDPTSPAYRDEVLAEIQQLGLQRLVDLNTDFLSIEDVEERLGAADVIVMPYDPTHESASAALRTVLPLGRPLVTSDITIFEDVKGMVPMLGAPVDPLALADSLEALWADQALRNTVAARVREHAEATSWHRVADRTRAVYERALSRSAGHGLRAADE
jgi:glycosyltransferase involved in cell wall biosynthesis